MGIEETIQFLVDSAAAQQAKLAELEQNSALLEQALSRLFERQKILELWAAGVQSQLDESEERPFYHRRTTRSSKRATPPIYHPCRPRNRP